MKDKQIIYIDMDGVLCNFNDARDKALLKNPDNKYPQSEYNFFRKLKPIKRSKDIVKWLINSPRYDVYILTTPSIKNPMSYTEKAMWVKKHYGEEMLNKLIISPNKGLNKGDYLIDDNLSGGGQETFKGKLIHFGSEEFTDWHDVLVYLNKKYDNKR